MKEKKNEKKSIQIQDCVAETFGVSPVGLNEQMMVEIEPICECPCSSDELLEDDLLCQVNLIELQSFKPYYTIFISIY